MGKKIVLWAINPFELETRPDPAVIAELRDWVAANNWVLQPVHVLYVSSIDAPPDDYGSWIQQFMPAVESEVSNYLKGMELPGVQASKVLVHNGISIGSAVDALIRYAEDIEASWILTSSKGRSGIRRMALGSFAESLLTRSKLPVWVFGHGSSLPFNSKRILFSTDFSVFSNAAFERVVEQAARLGASITLFHCVNLPEQVVSGTELVGIANSFPVDQFLRDQTDWARSTAEMWIKNAEKKGVLVETSIQEVVPNVALAIVAKAHLVGAGVIAMTSTSGSISASLLGSYARQVVRQSECPVWVFGPKCLTPASEVSSADRAVKLG